MSKAVKLPKEKKQAVALARMREDLKLKPEQVQEMELGKDWGGEVTCESQLDYPASLPGLLWETIIRPQSRDDII